MFKSILLLSLICLSSVCLSAQTQQVEKSSPDIADTNKQDSKGQEKKEKDLVEGTVKLRVTFLASGEIGEVVVLEATPSIKELKKAGLLKQAIAAAKEIKFEPPKRNGQPYSVKKTVTYKFTIY